MVSGIPCVRGDGNYRWLCAFLGMDFLLMFPVRKTRFTAYLIFSGAEHGIWWRMFTPRGFRHVQLIIPADGDRNLFDQSGQCIVVNATSYSVTVNLFDKRARELADDFLDAGATMVLTWFVDVGFTREFIPRGFLTCVSIVKALIGVNVWYLITPDHLARWLIRNGAKRLEK